MKKGRQDNGLQITEELQQQKGEGRIFSTQRSEGAKLRRENLCFVAKSFCQ